MELEAEPFRFVKNLARDYSPSIIKVEIKSQSLMGAFHFCLAGFLNISNDLMRLCFDKSDIPRKQREL